jgi:hypothetical protein
MSESFTDEFGVEHHRPVAVKPYSSRPAPKVRLALGVAIAAMTLVLFQLVERAADSDPERSFNKLWLDWSDVWSQRFDRFVVPAVARVRNGDESAIGEVFFGGDPFVASEFEMIDAEWVTLVSAEISDAELAKLASTPEERITSNVEWERWFSSPRDDPIFEVAIDWNRAVFAAVEWDGTEARIDPVAFAALDAGVFRQRLLAAEAIAREGKRVDYEYTKLRHRLRWVLVVVVAVLIVAAATAMVWVRRAALRAVRRDQQRYNAEWRVCADLRRAAASR